MTDKQALVTMMNIETKILLIRGQKVMLDADLAELYEVETKVLNQAVKRNIERFPDDFMFQLTADEFDNLRFQSDTPNLRSQIVTLKTGRGQHRNIAPMCSPAGRIHALQRITQPPRH